LITATSRRVSRVCRGPGIGVRIVSSAGVKSVEDVNASPDDHFAASPNCRMIDAGVRRVDGTGRHPTIRAGIVFPARVNKEASTIFASPDDHFIVAPHCRMRKSSRGRVVGTYSCPTVRVRIVLCPIVKNANNSSTPDNHLAASPHRRVEASAVWRVRRSCTYPTVRGRVVPATAV
jgi:hypothetical protein